MTAARVFSRGWLPTTLLVVAAAAVCVRLGIWQLDRLEQRRAFNREYATARKLPVLDLSRPGALDTATMEWRGARAAGIYDAERQVAIRNQYLDGQYGYHLLTPLVLSPDRVVLVDRGWIPADGNDSPNDWRKYDDLGEVVVVGQLRRGASKPVVGGVPDTVRSAPDQPLAFWNNLDLERIAAQLPYGILPLFLQPVADGDPEPPIPSQPEVELTEGPHLGYAAQWFSFAAILMVGYPIYVRRQVEGAAG